MKYEIRQQISNHPTAQNIGREVVVYRVAVNMDVKQIIISARIEHFTTSGDGKRVLLPEFTREVKDWVISNDYEVKKRDENNQTVLDDNGEEIKVPAFDTYLNMLIQSPSLVLLIQVGIKNDDEEIKRFDQ